ncbi:hypothetical protein [Chryseobacterium sp. T1]
MKKYLFLLIALIIFSCDKEYDFLGENQKAVSTVEIVEVLQKSARVNAILNTDNGNYVIEKGVCYSTNPNPTTSDFRKHDSNLSLGSYSVMLNDLTAGTKYYVKAYAKNSQGTAYGEELTFTTSPAIPASISIISINNVTQSSANIYANISDDGGSTISERGVCYSTYNNNPTVNDSKINSGSGIGSFAMSISNLSSGVTYYIRAYAKSLAGISYSNVTSFKTLSSTIPVGLSTIVVSNISSNGATFYGSLTNNGGAPITNQGFVYSSTNTLPTTSNSVVNASNGLTSFNASVSNLEPNTKYYVRSFASNIAGTAYGNVLSFTTSNLTIGQSFQGGVVAYIFQPGDSGYVSGQVHGFIIPSSRPISSFAWGCNSSSVPTSTAFGTGNQNTNTIYSYCGSSSAAGYVYNYTSGGFSDWFLPSVTELEKIYYNKYALSLSLANYWTSSQASTTTAYVTNFSNGTTSSISKTIYNYILPIRKF